MCKKLQEEVGGRLRTLSNPRIWAPQVQGTLEQLLLFFVAGILATGPVGVGIGDLLAFS